MLKKPIHIVDDDQEDQELMKDAIESLGLTNEILFFKNGNRRYLNKFFHG